ncbi:MAG: bacterial transcriptional activator domain-containing protein [Chloroflexia bacterium]
MRTTRAPRADEALAVANARAAVQLYRGDYLAEALYDPWTEEERERLLAKYLAIAVWLGDALVAAGRADEAIEQCEEVLRRDPVYEDAYRTLMRAHASVGRRSQALRAYSRCVQALRNRLDVESLPETVRLYESIKQGARPVGGA